MKTEKLLTALTGILLAFAVSCGAAGCLYTGFDLNVTEPALLWLVCGLASFLTGLCLLHKRGAAAVLCLLALWAGYLWHRKEPGIQILQLLQRISYGYDRAYDWGVLRFVDTPWNGGIADYPLQIVGCLAAVAVCGTVCRGKRTWPAVTAALIPLFLCLVVIDTVPEEKYLLVLLTGVFLLLLSAAVRRMDTAQAARLVRLAALPAAGAMALLFLLIPKEGYVNQSAEVRDAVLSWVESLPEKAEDAAQQMADSVSGKDKETVNLKNLGRRSSLAYPVMEVTTDWSGTMYLRGQDYDAYTGTGWTATPHRSENFSCTGGEAAGSVEITTRREQKVCYLPYYPQNILTGGNMKNPDKAKTYSTFRWVLPDNWRSLVRQRGEGIWESEAVFATTLSASTHLDSARYLLLPNETRIRAEQLLETVLDGEETATDKADAIASYVRGSARYDRDPGRMRADAEDFALWFLEESDAGYCVHFASAAVVLLRAADVPARYVTGYLVRCQPGETVTVTADTAHAWAEYYESQLACWIPLEATPSEGLTAQTVPQERETVPPATAQTQERATEPSAPAQTTPSAEDNAPQTSVPGKQPQKKRVPLDWLWIPAGILAVWLQSTVRVGLRRRNRRRNPNDRALEYWQQILLLARLRGEPAPGELRALAQKAKFSQHTLTREELGQMETYIYDSVEHLKQKPWYRRLVYRYVLAVW